ncbi:hypothetical protein ABT065_34000 [Streptomyces sp. NPDC002764]|uniref:hypothetical protein n=1 Tax=Streptomyces sp. NPDC002764 TaxID=3154428 RepID=UPI00331875F8
MVWVFQWLGSGGGAGLTAGLTGLVAVVVRYRVRLAREQRRAMVEVVGALAGDGRVVRVRQRNGGGEWSLDLGGGEDSPGLAHGGVQRGEGRSL